MIGIVDEQWAAQRSTVDNVEVAVSRQRSRKCLQRSGSQISAAVPPSVGDRSLQPCVKRAKLRDECHDRQMLFCTQWSTIADATRAPSRTRETSESRGRVFNSQSSKWTGTCRRRALHEGRGRYAEEFRSALVQFMQNLGYDSDV